ncbi:MAG: hypothetical protein K2I64_06235 [Muribaculaceae bacterium]|nr:hypothetical protein [Muribaculaceae bacterium]
MLSQTYTADSGTKITFTYTVDEDPEETKHITLSLKNTGCGCGKSHLCQSKFSIYKTGMPYSRWQRQYHCIFITQNVH